MEEIRSNQGRIANVNKRQLERRRRKQLQRRKKVLVISAAGILTVATLFGIHKFNKNDFERVMPEGYMQIYTTEQVERNDTLTSIAEEYYDDDIYDSYYENINDYVEEIADINNISNPNRIDPYTTVIIPALTEENNIYMEQIEAIDAQIDQLPKWVDYEVQAGDTILGLSYLGAGNTDEAYSIQYSIMDRNDLDNSTIVIGQRIQIVNPEIGALKKEREILREKLHESLKVSTEKSL